MNQSFSFETKITINLIISALLIQKNIIQALQVHIIFNQKHGQECLE